MDKVVDLSFTNELCHDAYTPDFGRPAYEPAMMFKILFLQFLYNISDRLSIVDSTHVKAKVDIFKIKGNLDASPDKDARHGYKGKSKPFYGYKAHASMDADSNLITKLSSTPGNTNDGSEFPKVVDTKAGITTADKAYDSNKNHHLLKKKKAISAIITKKNRKSRRIKKHQVKPEVVSAQRERAKIERKFAELKRFHGLEKARYWGVDKMAIQFTMTAIACNLKRMIKLLFCHCCRGGLFYGKARQGIPVPILAWERMRGSKKGWKGQESMMSWS